MTVLQAPTRSRRDPTVWTFVLFTGVVFGAGGLLAKGLVDDGVDAFTVTWFPFLAGGLIGLVQSARRRELRANAMSAAVVLALGASAAPALMFNVGFENLSAGVVTLLMSLGPVFTAVVAHFAFADERFNTTKVAGLALAVVGVAVLASGSVDGDGSAAAMALVILGTVTAGSAAVAARRFVLRHGATALIAPQLTIAGIVALTLSPVLGRSLAPAGGFETWHVLSLLAFGLTSYLGFLSMLKANEVGTTGQVSVIGYCIPLFGVLGGIVIFGDAVTMPLVLGGLLIVMSVGVIAAGSRHRS